MKGFAQARVGHGQPKAVNVRRSSLGPRKKVANWRTGEDSHQGRPPTAIVRLGRGGPCHPAKPAGELAKARGGSNRSRPGRKPECKSKQRTQQREAHCCLVGSAGVSVGDTEGQNHLPRRQRCRLGLVRRSHTRQGRRIQHPRQPGREESHRPAHARGARTGCLLGFENRDSGVMAETLAGGTRRIPSSGSDLVDVALLDQIFADDRTVSRPPSRTARSPRPC